MERKLSWSSGVFEEIGLVYDKAERSGKLLPFFLNWKLVRWLRCEAAG